jgi:glycosyltransferase involved in cell wall biosynthesis
MELKPEILERRVETSKATLNLLFIGKDSYRKGLDKILKFQSSMELLGNSTTLHIIGLEGDDNDNPNVIYHGFLPANSVEFSEIFEQSHLGFLVSRSEALGIAALEYQAAGIPTVLSGIDGMQSAVRTSTCLLDSSDDLEPTVKLVNELIVTGAYQQFLTQAFEYAVKARDWSSIIKKVVNEIES